MTTIADFNTYKRQTMADQQRTAKTKEDYDFERLIRQALSGNDFLVYAVLVDMVDNEEKVWCWPSLNEIQERAGYIDRKTVLKAIFRLEEYGLLEVIRSPRNPHKQLPNQYRPVKKRCEGLVTLLKGIVAAKKAAWEAKEWNYSTTTTQGVEKIPVSGGKNPISGVEKIHTNVTQLNVTHENELIPTTDVVGPTTIDLPIFITPIAFENFSNPSSRHVEAVQPGPVAPFQQDRGGDEQEIHIPVNEPIAEKSETKRKARAPVEWKSDPRILAWQKYAKLKGYRGKFGYFPETAQAKLIMEKVPLDLVERWDRLIQIWLNKRFFIGNVFDLVDVFVNGWKPVGKVKR